MQYAGFPVLRVEIPDVEQINSELASYSAYRRLNPWGIVAFNNDRQLVVLDDVFTYTDTTRLARIATILDEATDRFQIVLLTCHPERYHGLPNAKFFDLERLATP